MEARRERDFINFIKMKEIIIEVLSEGAELDETEKIKDSVVLGAEEMRMTQESVLNASEITPVIYEPKEAAEFHGGLAACSWKCFTEYCIGILNQTKRYQPNSHKGHGYKGG